MRICPDCKRRVSGRACPFDGSPTVEESAFEDDSVGKVLDGRYRLEARVGSGGMGTVYGARVVGTGQRVAVKLLSPALARDLDAAGRFVREAKVASRLRHPNSIDILGYGSSEAGLYIVMELLEGESLDVRIARSGRLPPVDVARIARGVARGLDAAHRSSIVHRDLKPGNVFLHRESAGKEVVKLLDFGVAKFVADGRGHGPLTTQFETKGPELLGTVTYMAPELILGRPLDGRTDLYALGVLLHYALAGEPPFASPEPMAVLYMHLQDEPPALPEDVPAALCDLTRRLLAKAPDDRPADAGQVAVELSRILQDLVAGSADTIAAPPPFDVVHPGTPPRKGLVLAAPPASTAAGASSGASPEPAPPRPAPPSPDHADPPPDLGPIPDVLEPIGDGRAAAMSPAPGPGRGRAHPMEPMEARKPAPRSPGRLKRPVQHRLARRWRLRVGAGALLVAAVVAGLLLWARSGPSGGAAAPGPGTSPAGVCSARELEACRASCESGRADHCLVLGRALERGEVLQKDLPGAAELYGRACDLGARPACRALGAMLVDGRGVPSDPVRAAGLLGDSCGAGDAPSCSLLGILHEEGRGAHQDARLAGDLYQTGCQARDPVGCYRLAQLAQRGAVATSERQADLYCTACEGGHADACEELGRIVAARGGMAADVAAAARAFEAQCNSGPAAGCRLLASVREAMAGPRADKTSIDALLGRACDGGDGEGCYILAGRQPARAAELLDAGCNAGHGPACVRMAGQKKP